MNGTDMPVITIRGIAAGGEGIGSVQGKTVFVRYTAPGDTIRYRITADYKNWARAELIDILTPSPERAKPLCPHYGLCGGCDLQHISYEAQLSAKTTILKDAFTRIGGIMPPEPEIFPSSPWEYRNRMQVHCISQFHARSFGLKTRNSKDIIQVTECPVADSGINGFLQKSGQEQLPLSCPGKERFTVYARDGLLLFEGGQEQGKTRLLNREICLDVSVFFQSNAAMLETLILRLKEIAADADHSRAMADLYCGVGTFAAFLGHNFPQIDLAEQNRKALDLARKNTSAISRDTSVNFFANTDANWAKLNRSGYGFVIADPPRKGLAPGFVRWLVEKGPPLFAYVSCNPATLARDSKVLCKGGYELKTLAFFDFYPQTSHIESLAVFIR